MTQPTNIPNQQPVPKHPFPQRKSASRSKKAESLEVACKHKNDGQKDHKGAQ